MRGLYSRVIKASASIVVKPGQTYITENEVGCRDGSTFLPGAKIHIIEATDDCPYFEVGPKLHNWLVAAPNGITVWATIEHCIERGIFQLVEET